MEGPIPVSALIHAATRGKPGRQKRKGKPRETKQTKQRPVEMMENQEKQRGPWQEPKKRVEKKGRRKKK